MTQNPARQTETPNLDAVRDALARALEVQGIPFSNEFDAFRIEGYQLFVRPVQLDQRHFRFDAFIAMEECRALEPVCSYLMQGDAPTDEAARRAVEEWIQACLEPLRRAARYGEYPDTMLNLAVDRTLVEAERRVLFEVFAGPYLVCGRNREQWHRRLPHSLIDWLVARGEFRVPDRPFNLLRIGKHIDASGRESGLSMIDRSKWHEADRVLQELDWPGTGEQQLLNFVVLRRTGMPEPGED